MNKDTAVGDCVQIPGQSPPAPDEWHTTADWVLLPAKYIPRILEMVREWDAFDSPE